MSIQDKPRDIEAWLDALGAPSADRDYKPGHARIQALIAKLETRGLTFHRPKLRVRIAGTNGKGSTAHFLAAGLQTSGLKVGLYTSPHILSFHERMRINGEVIKQDSLLEFMALVMPLALDIGTSYFETATVLALLHFSQQHVDVEILEAGVGAKLDATTAVVADMALLTPIGLDHQAWLGDALSEIAREKAFVFQGCDIQISAKQNNTVTAILLKQTSGLKFSELYVDELAALGEHQYINAGLAYAALEAIAEKYFTLGLKKGKRAISQLHITGRMQCIIHNQHTFYLDAAHNEHAVQALLPTLEVMKPFDLIILATRDDRDLSGCAQSLKRTTNKLVIISGETKDYSNVYAALDVEVELKYRQRILVLGSFVTLSSTMGWLNDKVGL